MARTYDVPPIRELMIERNRAIKTAQLVRAIRFRNEHSPGPPVTADTLMDWPESEWKQLARDAGVRLPSQPSRRQVVAALSPTPYEVELHERNALHR